MRLAHRAIFIVIAFIAGAYYFWAAQAPGHPFQWGYDLGGYYNYLARGFTGGHLYVPIQPNPQLLALPNPYVEGVDDSLKVWDMVLYRGRYYLYHGVAPEVLLFTPWRLVTGHDVPENFGLALFCLAGFLFSAGTLMRLLRLARMEVSAGVLAVLLIALAFCQDVPFLFGRVWVYEIAIGCAYCCLSGAVFFLARSIQSGRPSVWLAGSGLMFGLAIASRPHLGIAAIIATAALAIQFARKRHFAGILPFLVPLTAVGIGVMIYNYERFGHPLEFGVRYVMGSHSLSRTELSKRWVLPGLYYLVISPPDLSAVFPWIRLVARHKFEVTFLFVEPIIGCLFLAPFVIGIFFLRRACGGMVSFVALITATAVLLFLAGTGFNTQRYEVDFLPLGALAAAAGFAAVIARRTGWQKRGLTTLLVGLVAIGTLTNLAIAVAGPYDDFLKGDPRTYTRIAAWFSPVARYRPLLDPNVDVEFTAACTPHDDGFREPLLALGHYTFREVVALEHHSGKFRILAQSDRDSVAQEIENPGARPMSFQIAYHTGVHKLTVSLDGREVLSHELEHLLTAPAQVTVGANQIAPEVSAPAFTGRLERVNVALK